MTRNSSKINRISQIILAEGDYQYSYDPEHRNRPDWRAFETEKGWSNDPKDNPKNNPHNVNNNTYQMDSSYFNAIKSGDMETVRRMVDERAEASGYLAGPVKHGTASEHTVFDKKMGGSITDARSARQAFFFSDDDLTARAYATYAAEDGPIKEALTKAEESEKRGDWDGYDKYLQIAEKLDTPQSREELRKKAKVLETYLSGKFFEYDAEGKSPSELSDDGDIDQGITGLIKQAKRKGFSGVIIRNFNDAVGLSNRPATHFIVFNPNQIKSADPIVKDDNGNIIPLSQRFNSKSNDIRY